MPVFKNRLNYFILNLLSLHMNTNPLKKIIILFVIFSLLLSLKCISQTTVSIEDCQQWAVAQSSANVQKELNEQLLRMKINDASSHWYPTLEINGLISYQSHVPQLPISIPGVETLSKDQYRIGLDLYQVLFDGGKIFYNRKYELLDNKNEIHKLDISINQLKEQVIAIYLNLLIIEKQLNILTSVENTLAEQLDQFRILLKEGVVYGNAVAQLELEELKIAQQKGALQATKESLISSLSILTGRDLSEAEFLMPHINEIEVDTHSERLEYAIFDNQIAGLEYQRKLHYANTIPQLALIANGGYGRTPLNPFKNDFDWFYFIGIKLNVPIINWAKTTGVGDIIRLQKSILEAQKYDFEKANRIDIQEKINEINRIQNLLILDNQITEKYQSLTKTYRTQLLNGTITAYDFIKQQSDEIQSLINQEVHTIQLLKAKYELLALKGKL